MNEKYCMGIKTKKPNTVICQKCIHLVRDINVENEAKEWIDAKTEECPFFEIWNSNIRRTGSTLKPIPFNIKDIETDRANGMKWKDIAKKYNTTIKEIMNRTILNKELVWINLQ